MRADLCLVITYSIFFPHTHTWSTCNSNKPKCHHSMGTTNVGIAFRTWCTNGNSNWPLFHFV